MSEEKLGRDPYWYRFVPPLAAEVIKAFMES